MDWYDIRFRFSIWFWRTWPFRVLAWLHSRGVPIDEEFGTFDYKDDHSSGRATANRLPFVHEKNNMTLPYERTRAIIETRSFLEQLTNPRLTQEVPEPVRQQALALLRHYPFETEIDLAHIALPDWFGPVQGRQ